MTVKIFYGYKINQTRTFNDKGTSLVVTKIKTAPISVKRIKSEEKDGYNSLQVLVGKGLKKYKSFIREIKLEKESTFKPGDTIKVNEVLKAGDKIAVTGITKGKGFAGVVKRWGFKGGPRTHGQSDRQRAPGSIGQGTDPGRVWKGKKMPGHMGNITKTIKGLKVYKINEEKNELWLTGLVPGNKSGLIKITKV
ncbi:50S ribosomal protein L3 [Patescibacteria group bacterium]